MATRTMNPIHETTQLQAGDQVLAILEPGKEDELRNVLLHADSR